MRTHVVRQGPVIVDEWLWARPVTPAGPRGWAVSCTSRWAARYSRAVPIPPLEPTGLLPPGIHDATLDEIQGMFGSANDTRTAIMAGLSELVVLVRAAIVIRELYIDGSFITSKAVPGDVDVVAMFQPSDFLAFATSPHATLLVNRGAVKSKYKVDLLLGPNMGGMVTFFQGLRPERALELRVSATHKKGILRVRL